MATQTQPIDPNAAGADATAFADEREQQFHDVLAEMLGDEAPEPAEDETERPSADSKAGDEGEDAVSPEAETETPDPKQPETPAADATDEEVTPEDTDLLATATPFTYAVDGQAKTIDGIREIPGHGAIVEAQALGTLKDRLQKADRLDDANRALYQKTQAYETVEYQGKTGMAAIEAAIVDNAKLSRALTVLVPYLESEEGRIALATDPQGTLQYLTRELGLTARETEFQTRQSFGQKIRAAETQQQESTTLAQQAETAITQSISHWAQQFPALTAQDKDAATQYLRRIQSSVIRPATPEEAQQVGVKPGERIVDHTLVHGYLANLASLRAEAQKATQTASEAAKAAQKASQENAKRLAAAAVPTKHKPTAKATPKQQARTNVQTNAATAMSEADKTAKFMRQLRSGQWPDEIAGSE